MKYKINEKYFDNLDTEDKNYFLGLLMADGHNNGKNVSIALSGDDKIILEKLSSIIYENYRPLLTNNLSLINKLHKDSHKLYICNMNICKRLSDIGMTKNKTYDMKFPKEIDDINKFRHFLRGYFDGDGCVTIQNKRITFSIVGEFSFLTDMLSKISEYLNIKIVNKIYKTSSFASEIKIGSKKIVRELYKFMYQDSNYFLERKKIKFDDFFGKKENNIDKVPSSNYKYVTFDKLRNKWKVAMWDKYNKKNINIGRYETELDAYKSSLVFLLKNPYLDKGFY
jgi:hypothetical protein